MKSILDLIIYETLSRNKLKQSYALPLILNTCAYFRDRFYSEFLYKSFPFE